MTTVVQSKFREGESYSRTYWKGAHAGAHKHYEEQERLHGTTQRNSAENFLEQARNTRFVIVLIVSTTGKLPFG